MPWASLKVTQGRAAERECAGERFCARRRPACSQRTRLTPVAARARVDAGFEQRFAGIDVAGADDDRSTEQRLLDRDAAAAQRRMQMLAPVKAGSNGSRPSPASSLPAMPAALLRRPHDRTEAPRVGQAQGALRGDEVEVIVRAGLAVARAASKASAARHAQVHQQATP